MASGIRVNVVNSSLQNRLFIGTAGWSIPGRYIGEFAKTGSHLERYAKRLNAVEINSSFYRSHKQSTYARWAESVPATFRFAVKVPKAITHERRLGDCSDLLDRLVAELHGLGDKLGALLVQLPPSLSFDPHKAEAFFAELVRRTPVSVACEARHPGWFTPPADTLLRAYGVARVAADPPPVAGADEPGGAASLVYLRLHGTPRIYYSDYDTTALDHIAKRLVAFHTQKVPVWCVFDNTAQFHALGNALAINRQWQQTGSGPALRG